MLSWRHQGEEDANAVYNLGISGTLLLQIASVTALKLSTSDSLIWMFFAVLTIPYTIAARRRAIIFTATEVIYRPALISLRRAKFSEITALKMTSTAIPFGLIAAIPVRGISMVFSTGRAIAFPLDLKKRSEVLQRLSD